ncbi:choloylglycine hydrolase [Candidatus Saccharibacteria bacterium]|nr:choloylglycine hydrolase [Candidatus Saccharibacteria bacterium]
MCSGIRFSDDAGNMFFGRNLDWCNGYGQGVVVTPRGFRYESAFLGEMAIRYAVIGMAVVADNKPLYFDCGNEAGLAIAGLNFPGYAEYEHEAISGKMNVAAYEFPLFVAANFATVDEAEVALQDVAIVAKPVNTQFPVSELHFMIGDGKRSIVVEYTANGMEIYDNPVDVLTNQPGYAWHYENLRNYLNLDSRMPKEVDWRGARLTAFGTGGLMRGLPGDYYSPSRFVRLAYLNAHYPVQSSETDNVLRLFHSLQGVAMIDGAAAMADGKFEKTIYTSGFSAATRTYYYNTYENPTIQQVKMDDCDLGGEELVQF